MYSDTTKSTPLLYSYERLDESSPSEKYFSHEAVQNESYVENLAEMSAPTMAMTLIAALVWACLSGTNSIYKNVLYTSVLPNLLAVETVLLSITLILALGLLDIVQLSTPPTIAYLKTLPAGSKNQWGVYLLVLEKVGCRPKIYIGSGTGSRDGVLGRLRDYDLEVNLPQYVRQALKDGF